MSRRCYCCGTLSNMKVCSTCLRYSGYDKDFISRVNLAKEGIPQVCLSCGWDKGCNCNEPVRQ